MESTDKFEDANGDCIQSFVIKGLVAVDVLGSPWLTAQQAKEFACQLIEVANEAEANQ